MKPHRLIILAIVVACVCYAHAGCAANPASDIVKPIADDWKGVTDRGTFTAPELNHHSDVIATAQKQASAPPIFNAAAKAAPNILADAATGNWLGLAGQVAGVLVAAGGAGVVTYKKVMKDRDASSAERTADDLKALGKV